MRLAEPDYEVFVTMDRQLPFKQNPAAVALCVIILLARSSAIADLRLLAPALRSAVADANAGQVATIEA